MIPQLDLVTIENSGERAFYAAARELPAGYTVLYSYRYLTAARGDHPEHLREADFVIVHPERGFLVVEVKGGDRIAFRGGRWHRETGGVLIPLNKDPVEQARTAMFAILDRYKAFTRQEHFPLNFRFAVCFPDCSDLTGTLPAFLYEHSVFLAGDLYTLEEKIRLLLGKKEPNPRSADVLVNKVLAPAFMGFTSLQSELALFHRASERALTEEQDRILEETELNRRMIFFGAAGTGKTFLALEKARRLALTGQKVLLTCFNKNLAAYFHGHLPPGVTAVHFHDYLVRTLKEAGLPVRVPKDGATLPVFFDKTLPDLAFDYFAAFPAADRFDALLVDEGQDFRAEWLTCLEAALKEDGQLFIFADPHQSVFRRETAYLDKIPVSRHRLTRNLRNTETINLWLSGFLPAGCLRSQLRGGLPIGFFPWQTPEEERELVRLEVTRLLGQGLDPRCIVILSPNVREKSCLDGQNKLGKRPLADIHDPRPSALRFATIRSFKGLEAAVVFLIGLKAGSLACTPSDIYTGASRARFLLNIFHHRDLPVEDPARLPEPDRDLLAAKDVI